MIVVFGNNFSKYNLFNTNTIAAAAVVVVVCALEYLL
jgi:hypothetical protein